MKIHGLHHITSITDNAQRNFDFFTHVLGMRLVKKTVNQDDIQTYHTFFADAKGSPGTDITFFDFKDIPKGVHGRDEISRIGLRIPSLDALAYWKKRLTHYQVAYQEVTLHQKPFLFFNEADGQQYAMAVDEGFEGVLPGEPWNDSKVPNEFQIIGLGPVFFNVSAVNEMDAILTQVLGFKGTKDASNTTEYTLPEGGHGATIYLTEDHSEAGYQGYGTVHHVAFRVEDKAALDEWIAYFSSLRVPHSGFVDRFYFKSLYTRLYRPILFEFATDGPGFIDDEEDLTQLGQTLALPPKLRPLRDQIEKSVRPLDTSLDTPFEKEVF